MGSILIVTEIQAGRIREASYELAAFAQEIGGDIHSLVCGKGVDALADEFSKKGGGTVHVADADVFENYNAEATNAAIKAAIEATGADLVLVSNTPSG
jgi:electron transfer flavoprotein alpha subunit